MIPTKELIMASMEIETISMRTFEFQEGMFRVSCTMDHHTTHGKWVPYASFLPAFDPDFDRIPVCGSFDYVAGTIEEVRQWRAKVGNSTI